MSAVRVAAIVLAAGSSRRMGDANKLLAEVGGAPLVLGAVRALAGGGASPIIAVTGHDHGAVAAALAGAVDALVHNPDHAAGMGGSIAAGARAIDDRASAVLVALGDMPRIAAETVSALIEAHRREPEVALAPAWDGRRGHPVLFPSTAFAALRELAGDRGARDVFAAMRHRVIDVEDSGVALDVDTPAELDLARSDS